MREGEPPQKAAAALRTALVGRPITFCGAPGLVGPVPSPGRFVERVESHGRHLEIVWDDGLVLHTHLRMTGTWQLYRHGERWDRSVLRLQVEIRTADWVAACFAAPLVETHRLPDRTRHPGFGRFGPNFGAPGADVDEAINRLYHYRDQSVAVAEALLDDHVAEALGNVTRCEALWITETHPFAPVSALDATDCEQIIRAAAVIRSGQSRCTSSPAVYGRTGQPCPRCGDPIVETRSGDHARLLSWCPGCQQHRSPIASLEFDSDETREMDPHPAAVRFMSDLPWRRNRIAG